MITYILASLIVVALFSGMPIFAVFLAATMLGFYNSEVDLVVIAIELYRMVDTPLLLSLPLFTFAGYLLSESNTSERLLRLTRALFGWMPDGIAIVALVICAFFTAFTGATGVTIVALGALLLPALIKAGYKESFSLGLVTSSGSLGLLLPPSMPLIIYGIIVQQMQIKQQFGFDELFLAGLLPGLLMIFAMALWSIWANRGTPLPKQKLEANKILAALWDARWEVPLPIFVFIGIFGGIFAISEVAAMVALYVLIVEVFIYKEIKLNRLVSITENSMVTVGGILLILGVSFAFTNYLIDSEVSNSLFNWVQEYVDNKFTFLLLLNIFLLLLGAILDIFSALVVVVPLIVPIAMSFGIHPLHLGIIFLANMQLGYFTPPVGMNLFIASYRFQKPILDIYRASFPFFIVLLICVLIITYWPWLTLVFIN
ncbi:MAG: TRAP transporter large permease subunit [Gammaproteobacteria bacterium]|nr:TRAP transporter large permease subunit [Gammaproteobacteria bacterium]